MKNGRKFVDTLKNDVSWAEAYKLGKKLYSENDALKDAETLKAFNSAFHMGLNAKSDITAFLEATRIQARLLVHYGDYYKARNQLLLLLNIEETGAIMNWVHMYYAITLIHTDAIELVAMKPEILFNHLTLAESIEDKNQLRYIYKDFLNSLSYGIANRRFKSLTKDAVASEAIIENGKHYNLGGTREMVAFQKILGKEEFQEEDTLPLKTLGAESVITDKDREIQRLQGELWRCYAQIEKLQEALRSGGKETTEKDFPLRRNQKILVIGASRVKENALRGIAKNLTGLKKEDMEFVLDYDRISSYAGRIKPYSSRYAGILVGPSPHKTEGTGKYSSFIESLKTTEGYPPVMEIRTRGGELKITKEAFKDALERMMTQLYAEK